MVDFKVARCPSSCSTSASSFDWRCDIKAIDNQYNREKNYDTSKFVDTFHNYSVSDFSMVDSNKTFSSDIVY